MTMFTTGMSDLKVGHSCSFQQIYLYYSILKHEYRTGPDYYRTKFEVATEGRKLIEIAGVKGRQLNKILPFAKGFERKLNLFKAKGCPNTLTRLMAPLTVNPPRIHVLNRM